MVLAFGLSVTASVQATNFGSEGIAGVGEGKNGVWFTENSTFTVAKRAMTAMYSAGVSDALIDEYFPTDLTVSIFTTDACVDANHDTCVYDDDYGDNGLNGWNACWGSKWNPHPDQVCSVAWVRINLFYSPPAKRIACHEIAHSVGLRHTQEQASCVKRTADGGNSEELSDHDKSHINSRY